MATDRPEKPYAGFPLFAHAKGYWCKKINKKQHSFGPWAWPEKKAYERSWKDALERYHRYQADAAHGLLLFGNPERMSITHLVKAYLDYQHDRAVGESAEIYANTYTEIKRVVEEFRDAVGKDTTIEQLELFDPLRPEESPVAQYIKAVKKKYGWHAYNKRMTRMSGMWNWAENPVLGALRRPFRLRSFFSKRAEKLKRRAKRLKGEEQGKQRWTVEELQAFFDLAPLPLRAMIGLGYFGAFGPSDCSDLPIRVIKRCRDYHLPDGWGALYWVRTKTEIERGEALPGFVLDDLAAAIRLRPQPAYVELEDRVFLTHFGNAWVRTNVHFGDEDKIEKTVDMDSLNPAFAKFRNGLGRCAEHGWFARPQVGAGFRSDKHGTPRAQRRPKGLGLCPACGASLLPMRKLPFYTFRHTALTYAGGAGADPDAVHLFEGHQIPGIRREYIEEVEAHRLLQIGKRLLEKLEPIAQRSVFRTWIAEPRQGELFVAAQPPDSPTRVSA